MKKLFITLTVIAGMAFSANAQEFGFKQGDVLLEGNIGFESTNNKNTEVKTNGFTLAPKASYFLSDKLAIGVGLNFVTGKEERALTGYEQKTNNFGAEVFGRYYFLELGKRFKTYAVAAVGFGADETETTLITGGATNTVKANDFGINAGVGANYFLTEKIALNFQLANIIGFNSTKPDGGKAESSFGLNAGNVNNIFDAATFGIAFKF